MWLIEKKIYNKKRILEFGKVVGVESLDFLRLNLEYRTHMHMSYAIRRGEGVLRLVTALQLK